MVADLNFSIYAADESSAGQINVLLVYIQHPTQGNSSAHFFKVPRLKMSASNEHGISYMLKYDDCKVF